MKLLHPIWRMALLGGSMALGLQAVCAAPATEPAPDPSIRLLRERITAGRVTVMGAIYDLEQGKVSWLGTHPAQDALVVLADQAETDAALGKNLSGPTPSTVPATVHRPGQKPGPTVVAREAPGASPAPSSESRSSNTGH